MEFMLRIKHACLNLLENQFNNKIKMRFSDYKFIE